MSNIFYKYLKYIDFCNICDILKYINIERGEQMQFKIGIKKNDKWVYGSYFFNTESLAFNFLHDFINTKIKNAQKITIERMM